MTNDDSRLDALFEAYRASCPDIEAGVGFMPAVWQKIEARHSFWFAFQHFARTAMTGCAALCLLLLVLNFVSATQNRVSLTNSTETSYTDALLAEHTAERTYYTEAIRSTPASDDAPEAVR